MTAADKGGMPRPGHYAGTTSQSGTISFDVSEPGWHVTNLMLTVTAGPPRGGRTVRDLPVAIDRIFPVAPGGCWWARVSGGGVTVTIEAHFNGSGIEGDLCVDIDSGGAERLSTGPLTWSATLREERT